MLPIRIRPVVVTLLVTAALWSPALLETSRAEAGEPASERIAVGRSAPEIALEAAGSGTVHRLSDLAGERPAVVVFFRGTW